MQIYLGNYFQSEEVTGLGDSFDTVQSVRRLRDVYKAEILKEAPWAGGWCVRAVGTLDYPKDTGPSWKI